MLFFRFVVLRIEVFGELGSTGNGAAALFS
jgi:hypothetical protein